MINIDMDAIKSRMARVVRDERGKVKVFNTEIVDDAVALIAEVERLNKAYTELAKALPEVCFGGCTGDSSVGIPDCPLVEYQQDGKPRCKYAPELEIAPRAAMTRESPFDTEIRAPANRILSLAEVLALPEGARVWVECGAGAGRSTGEYEMIEVYGTRALMNMGDDEEFFLMGNWLAGFLGKFARVWHLPFAPTEDELAKYEWEVRDDG